MHYRSTTNANDTTTTPCRDFLPSISCLLDALLGTDNKYAQYTSSIFPKDTDKIDCLYEIVDDMDRGDTSIILRGVRKIRERSP